MCGISGVLSAEAQPNIEELSRSLAQTLSHRGPDQLNTWSTSDNKLGFAHNRLKIIDLTEAGAQPMTSHSGRYTICYNGEIYNYQKLKSLPQLSGTQFKGQSDTEVLLELIDAVGFEQALNLTEGMFALALWDNQDRRLFLARDRIGEKPLYYGMAGNSFVFASELKALSAHPDFQESIDQEALYLFLKYNYVPAPHSIYQGVRKIPAGSFIHGKTPQELMACEAQYYWDVTSAPQGPKENWSEEQSIEKLESLLLEVMQDEMISDVPLGAFLSGGIDSSLICALAQKVSSQKLKTFTIGYDVEDYDESKFAKQVAKHLGTEHTEWIVNPDEIRKLIPEVPKLYDEPFADSSQLPTTLLSRMTQQHVTVALSGDGGDELFGGYNRHVWLEKIFNVTERLPKFCRSAMAKAIHALPPSAWTTGASALQVNEFGTKLYKVAQILESNSAEEVYDQILSTWSDPHQVINNSNVSPKLNGRPFQLESLTEQMMLMDTQFYLPDDIMTKVDRAAMSTSLESRAPFLNHRVFEMAWQLPMNYKIRNKESKWILRKILYKHVPKDLIERPKQGFGVPINKWFRDELREWVSDSLSRDRIQRQGILNADAVDKCLQEHLSGKKDNQYHLWSLIVFQSWYDEWMS